MFHYLEVQFIYLQVNVLQSQDQSRVSVKAPETIPKWGVYILEAMRILDKISDDST